MLEKIEKLRQRLSNVFLKKIISNVAIIFQYFEYYVAFERIDESGDHRLDLKELEDALPKLETWVGPVDDVEKVFKDIDKDGHGKILFNEFCEWATEQKLDLEDDDD